MKLYLCTGVVEIRLLQLSKILVNYLFDLLLFHASFNSYFSIDILVHISRSLKLLFIRIE